MNPSARSIRYIKAAGRVRIPVVSGSWAARHLETLLSLQKSGPVLIVGRSQKVFVTMGVLDYVRLANRIPIPPRRRKRFDALVQFLNRHPVQSLGVVIRRATSTTAH